MIKQFLAGAAFMVISSAALAQSLSVADLQAQIDAELSKGNEYAELLNDPDPARAQKAMELMLASGDDMLVKAALDYGIYSPDKTVRNLAIKAYLDTNPRLEVQFDGKKADRSELVSVMSDLYGLSPNKEGFSTTTMDIEGFDDDANCYFLNRKIKYSKCFLRFVGETIQYRSSDGKWYEMTYLDAGALYVVSTQIYNANAQVALTIPLR